MTTRERHIADFTQGRMMTLLLTLLAGAATALSWFAGSDTMAYTANRGFALPSPNLWFFGRPLIALLLNAAALLGCGGIMVWLNRRYNILRSFSLTFVGLFLLMTAASPNVTMRFQGSVLLTLTVLAAILLFYSVYNTPRRASRRIFLAMVLLSAGTLCQYGFAVYILVFLMGIGQMRVLTFRTLTAALLGVATPWWLWWVFSSGFPHIHIPELDNPFATLMLADRIRFFTTVGITLFAGLILGSYNLLKIYSYNAKARSLNGLLTVVSVITGLAALVDWTNMPFYVPLLNVCVAFQTGHFFHINIKHRWGYLTVVLLAAVYSGLWVWSRVS